MKERNHRPIIRRDAAWACHSRFCLCLLVLCLLGSFRAQAQKLPLADGERADYELYFKWGLLMPKAGLATLSVRESPYAGKPAWNYRLLFRTIGMMEKVFSMRDTIDCHFSTGHQLLYSSKRTNEGDYYLIDNLRFNYLSKGNISIHSHRYHWEQTKIDTVLTASGNVFDMLGATMYMRSISWETIKNGDEFPFSIVVGKDVVKAHFRYAGQQIVERGDTKYRTRHFYIDIFDPAFTQSKEAAEVWIGDDDNRLPIKIRAKLKIGAAEVYLKESYNLRYPLACRVVLSRD